MNEIKAIKLILNDKGKFLQKYIYINKYLKNLFFDIGPLKFLNYLKKNNDEMHKKFMHTWESEIIKVLKLKKNWRNNSKHHQEAIDYDILEKIFRLLSNGNKSILDLGSYDGYFIKYYSCFSKIILSDITPHSNLYSSNPKFSFYLLNRYDLSNIKNSSIDTVFSTDTLVRLNKKTLKLYFKDFGRIVKTNGYLILHVPNIFNINSVFNSYTNVSSFFYKRYLKKYFDIIIFTNRIHKTSTFLIARRNNIKYLANKS